MRTTHRRRVRPGRLAPTTADPAQGQAGIHSSSGVIGPHWKLAATRHVISASGACR